MLGIIVEIRCVGPGWVLIPSIQGISFYLVLNVAHTLIQKLPIQTIIVFV